MDDLGNMIIAALKAHQKGEEKKVSRSESTEIIRKYFERYQSGSDIKAGDLIERNADGAKRYKLPMDGHVGICLERLAVCVSDAQGDYCDMLMAATVPSGAVTHFLTHSSFYQKAEGKRNVYKLKPL